MLTRGCCKTLKILKILKIIQQNDKSTQEYKGKIWIRSITTIAPMGKECDKGQQL